MHITNGTYDTINKWFQYKQKQNIQPCHNCNGPRFIVRDSSQSYNFFVFSLNVDNIAISKTIRVTKPDGTSALLPLKGVVYLGQNHFTAQIIDANKNIWFYDGITTKSSCKLYNTMTNTTEKQLMMCDTKQAVLVIYARK